MNTELHKALNNQINAEMYSAYLYLAMASHFESLNFKGMAHWMEVQAQEEMKHAMRFYRYLQDRNWEVKLVAIAEPTAKWQSPLAAFEAALKHEQEVTGMINRLMEMAVSSKEYATQSMLKWFVDEQVEEEVNAYDNVQKAKLIGSNQALLLYLDAELGKRKAE